MNNLDVCPEAEIWRTVRIHEKLFLYFVLKVLKPKDASFWLITCVYYTALIDHIDYLCLTLDMPAWWTIWEFLLTGNGQFLHFSHKGVGVGGGWFLLCLWRKWLRRRAPSFLPYLSAVLSISTLPAWDPFGVVGDTNNSRWCSSGACWILSDLSDIFMLRFFLLR